MLTALFLWSSEFAWTANFWESGHGKGYWDGEGGRQKDILRWDARSAAFADPKPSCLAESARDLLELQEHLMRQKKHHTQGKKKGKKKETEHESGGERKRLSLRGRSLAAEVAAKQTLSEGLTRPSSSEFSKNSVAKRDFVSFTPDRSTEIEERVTSVGAKGITRSRSWFMPAGRERPLIRDLSCFCSSCFRGNWEECERANEPRLKSRACDTDLDPAFIARQQKEGAEKLECPKKTCRSVLAKRSGEGKCSDCKWPSTQASWYACRRHDDVVYCMNCTAKRQFPWLHDDPLGMSKFRDNLEKKKKETCVKC